MNNLPLHLLARQDGFESVGLFLLFAVAAIIFAILQIGRPQKLLNQWAQRNNFKILSAHRRSFFRGPFFWTTGKNQVVYQISVEDRDGLIHNGYLRLGGFFWGMLSDHTEVRWDTPAPLSNQPAFPVILKSEENPGQH